MRTLAARRISQTALRTFLKWVKERPLPFVEDVEIDGALVENSKKYCAQGILHHHGSQLRAAVLDGWPSSADLVPETLRVPPMSEGVAATRT